MLVRSKVWWPGIDKQVEQMVKECLPCQAAVRQSPKCQPPLNMTKLPPHPWHTLHADFCGPFPNGEKLLVLIDAYSRYPEVEVMQSTTTTAVISKLQRIFAGHGYPEVLTTDNGPPRSMRLSSLSICLNMVFIIAVSLLIGLKPTARERDS